MQRVVDQSDERLISLGFEETPSELAEEPSYVNYILFLYHWLIYLDELLDIGND